MVDVLRAEWTKLRTVPSTGWLLLALTALIAAVGAAAAAGADADQDPAKVSLTGVQVGQVVVVALGVASIGGEYSTGMIGTTILAVPRRHRFFAAKAGLVGAMALVTGGIGVLGSVLAGRVSLSLSLTDAAVLRAAGGSVLYLALIALLSLGVTAVVRDTTAAIGVVLGLLYVFPIIANTVTDPDWQHRLRRIGPMDAGLAIQNTTGLRGLPIAPWPGLAVLAAWTAGCLLAGALVLHRRGGA